MWHLRDWRIPGKFDQQELWRVSDLPYLFQIMCEWESKVVHRVWRVGLQMLNLLAHHHCTSWLLCSWYLANTLWTWSIAFTYPMPGRQILDALSKRTMGIKAIYSLSRVEEVRNGASQRSWIAPHNETFTAWHPFAIRFNLDNRFLLIGSGRNIPVSPSPRETFFRRESFDAV